MLLMSLACWWVVIMYEPTEQVKVAPMFESVKRDLVEVMVDDDVEES
jgi:hypothetical protein